MKIQTFSIVAGTAACNAACPYCISKMTGLKEVGYRPAPVNWRNFAKACRLAQINQIQSVLITGKGEPTLYPDQITAYLKHLQKYNFPLIDLQTNGLRFQKEPARMAPYLKEWYQLGLSTIAVSIAHYEREKNREVYQPKQKGYPDLADLVAQLHKFGFTIRLSVTLIRGFIDSRREVKKMIAFAKELEAEQLTLRRLARPDKSEDAAIFRYTTGHLLTERQEKEIGDFLERGGHPLVTMVHGAKLYDVDGQNVLYTHALTLNPGGDDIRQLIFFPEGRLRFDWQYPGAVLL